MVILVKNIYILFVKYCKFHSRYRLNNFIYTNLPRNKLIINIGSNGETANLVNKLSKQVINIDIDISRNPEVIADIQCLPFNNIDCITCFDVLEHVESPLDAFNSIYTSLKIGGVALISIPFIFGIHDAPYDYQRLTRYQLIRYTSKFTSVSIQPSNYFFACIYVLLIRLINNNKKNIKILGIIFIIITLPFVPIIYLLDYLTKIDSITTRYHIALVK